MPDTITTLDELNTLRRGSVVLDKEGDAWQRLVEVWRCPGSSSTDIGAYLPVTVLRRVELPDDTHGVVFDQDGDIAFAVRACDRCGCLVVDDPAHAQVCPTRVGVVTVQEVKRRWWQGGAPESVRDIASRPYSQRYV